MTKGNVTEEDIIDAVNEYLVKIPKLRDKSIKGYSKGMMPAENIRLSTFGSEHVKYRLISKFDFPSLPIKILRKMPIYLLKQFEVQVEYDAYWFWALTHDVLDLTLTRHKYFYEWPLNYVFKTLMAAHFSSIHKNFASYEGQRLNAVIDEALSVPEKDLITNYHTITTYLSYPVLESLIKWALSPIIDMDGNIINKFKVDGKPYTKKNRKISSLKLLLDILEKTASIHLDNSELSENLKEFRKEIEFQVPKEKENDTGWDIVYGFRNPMIHGVEGWQLRSGLITNLICLIILHLIDDSDLLLILNSIKDHTHFSRWSYMPRDRFSYYPPVWL